MTGRARQAGDAAHERPADAEDVQVHVLVRPETERAAPGAT